MNTFQYNMSQNTRRGHCGHVPRIDAPWGQHTCILAQGEAQRLSQYSYTTCGSDLGAVMVAGHDAAQGHTTSVEILIILITGQHAPTHTASTTRWLPSMRARMLTSASVVLLMMLVLHCCRVFSCIVIARYTAVSVCHQSCAENKETHKCTNK
jgi:hypothetical protein